VKTKVTIGGVVYPASFTTLDRYELGKAGTLGAITNLKSVEDWQRLETMADFMAACVRRAGTAMTKEELLLAAEPTEIEGIFLGIAILLGLKPETAEEAIPNAVSPGTPA
jgi:hypothetical protein